MTVSAGTITDRADPSPIDPPTVRHGNALGFVRLLLASLVIVSHTPELIDGDRHRELLTRLFGTISFGEFAVDGFFVLSGYLIAGSYLKDPHIGTFLRKRTARIVPAFVVAWLLCFLVVTPLAGASLTAADLAQGAKALLTLRPPVVDGVFPGTPHALLNGAMWTISFEFRCYLLALGLGTVGLLDRPAVTGALAVVALALHESGLAALWEQSHALPLGYPVYVGDADSLSRFSGIFLVGATLRTVRTWLQPTPPATAACGLALIGCLFVPALAEPGLAVFGGWLMITWATSRKSGPFTRINNEDDISYGLYLYAWPIEKLLLWYWPGLGLVLTGLATWALAASAGWISWALLERPVLRRFGGA